VYIKEKPGSLPTDEEARLLNKHAEDEDLISHLIVQRTVTEDVFHQSTVEFRSFVVNDDTGAAESAISYLKKLHPGEFEEFTKSCWMAAQAHHDAGFPKRFPPLMS